MVSQRTRNAVWQNCLDVSWVGMHYETLASRCMRRRDFLRVALLVAVIGSAASPFMPLNHPAAAAILAIAAAVLALADYALNLAKKSAVLHQSSVDVARLEAEWNDLRVRMDDEDADDLEVRSEDRRLKSRLMDAAKRLRESGVAANDSLNRKLGTPMVSATPRRPPPPPAPPPPPPRPRKQETRLTER